jgi:hypothetical protein
MKLDHIQPGTFTKGRALVVRCVEKSGSSNSLHGKHERRSGRTLTHSARGSRAGLSRFDTGNASDPARNSMSAGFVAQVLGQVLETKPQNAIHAARVYARSARSAKDGRLIRVL